MLYFFYIANYKVIDPINMEKFRNLKLSEKILKVIEEAKFSEPSEIQEKTIPLILEGKDVLGSSATGSGKTLAFGAGIIEKIHKDKGIQALILTPTRELAEQISGHLKIFSKHFDFKISAVYGGVAIGPQVESIEVSNIVVGTPGRILDHLGRGTLNLNEVKFLVLDEADRMLEMGFIEDVVKIINLCPKERQTLLFSATISPDITRIAKNYMKNPVSIEVDSYVDAAKLKQIYYDVPQNKKFSLLVHLLKEEKSGLVMVFCNTRINTDMVVKNLLRYEIQAKAIHGGLTQNKRTGIMSDFHSSKVVILVCTDVAARGLDIKNVSHVYNYDIPKTNTEYIHRIGRTARAGKEGIAISLVSQRDYENFRRVMQDSSLNITNAPVPEIQSLSVIFKPYNRDRGGFDRRSSGGFSGRSDGGFRGRSRFGGRNRFAEGRGGEENRGQSFPGRVRGRRYGENRR